MDRSALKRIDKDLEKEIESMIKKIKEKFGITIPKTKASRLVAWKAKNSRIILTDKKLVEILGR